MTAPYVRLGFNFVAGPGTQTSADVYRSTTSSTGPWVFLQTVPLLAEAAVVFDTGAALGTNIWYRVVGNPGAREVFLGPAQLEQTSAVFVKDPVRPWADLEFDFCTGPQGHAGCGTPSPELVWVGFADEDAEADTSLLPITGSETPAVTFARRKDHTGSFQILTRTLAAKDAVYDLFTYGGPIMLQLPPVYGQGDIYVQPGTIKRARLGDDQRRPYRLITVPYTVVDAPVGPKQGTACANWCAITDAYPTFGDMVAAGGTWSDVATEVFLCGSTDGGYGDGMYGDGIYGE